MPGRFGVSRSLSYAATRRHCADEPSLKGLFTLELMNQLLPLPHVYLMNADTVPQHEQMAVRTIQCLHIAFPAAFSTRMWLDRGPGGSPSIRRRVHEHVCNSRNLNQRRRYKKFRSTAGIEFGIGALVLHSVTAFASFTLQGTITRQDSGFILDPLPVQKPCIRHNLNDTSRPDTLRYGRYQPANLLLQGEGISHYP